MKLKIFKLFLLVGAIFAGLFATHNSQLATISAQTNTPKPNAVDIIRKEIEEKVEEKSKLDQGEKKAFFGQIVDVFNRTIIIKTPKGKKTAEISEECSIVSESRKEIDFEDLEMETFLIAMGYAETDEKLITKRIVITEEPTKIKRTAFIGKVTKTEEKTLTVEQLQHGAEWEVSVTSKTAINKKADDELEEINLDEIEENDSVLVIGVSEKENEITAKIIRLLSIKETSPTPEESS